MATRKRHSHEQVVLKLMAADRLLSEGKDTAAVCRELGVSEATSIDGAISSVASKPRMPNGSKTSNARTPRSSDC